MEYIFQLGSFPNLSLAEIINVLESEELKYSILDCSIEELHIKIENINPEILLKILGGTKSIEEVETGKVYKQNIKEYVKREMKKPRVDAKSGLLPSKLAKMMINLSFIKGGVKCIYDPFCGGGTIITESNVMGIKAIGSDIDRNTIKDAIANSKWIEKEYKTPANMFEYFVSDIKDIDSSNLKQKGIDAIVTEPFLGKPVGKPLKMGKLDQDNIRKVDNIISIGVKKASSILNNGQRLVIIIPRFRSHKGIIKLDISENFNRFSFKKINPIKGLDIDKNEDLIYFRPGAVVIREIFILEKI